MVKWLDSTYITVLLGVVLTGVLVGLLRVLG